MKHKWTTLASSLNQVVDKCHALLFSLLKIVCTIVFISRASLQ